MDPSPQRNGTGTAANGSPDCEVLPPLGTAYPIQRQMGFGVNRDIVMMGIGAGAVVLILYLISKCKD